MAIKKYFSHFLRIVFFLFMCIVSLVIAFILYAYYPTWSLLEKKLNSNEKTIFFADLVPESWEKVCILQPYAMTYKFEDVEQFINANLELFKYNFPDINNDGRWAFLFIKNDKVTIIKRHKDNNLYAKYSLKDIPCIDRQFATFQTEDNKTYIKDLSSPNANSPAQ